MNIRAGKSLAQNIFSEKTCICLGKACALRREVRKIVQHIFCQQCEPRQVDMGLLME